jgi:glycosyltransferase involved in cell wall biosynthesis
MHILWVKVGGLWPLTSGGRLRSFHTLAELCRRHQVTVVTTHETVDEGNALAVRLGEAARVVSIPFAPVKRDGTGFPLALARSWASRLPVDLWKWRAPGIRDVVQRVVASGGVDLCVGDFLAAMPNIPRDLGGVPLVLFEHNVEHMIWRRICQAERRAAVRSLLEVEWRKMRRYEALACHRARLVLAVSEADRDRLRSRAPGARIEAVPTGVDIAYFAPNGAPEVQDELLFTGSMDWQPNEDAMAYFVGRILPAIRREMPGVRMTIVGRNPRKRLRELAGPAGVTVTGTVEDIRPFMARAAVYVVPLRIGGGTRLKVFEALAMGKAVVSTSIGVEGLPLAPGREFALADDPDEFARSVVSLLRDPAKRCTLGAQGRQLVVDRYSWSEIARVFEARFREVERCA